jgi:hypothetical protein
MSRTFLRPDPPGSAFARFAIAKRFGAEYVRQKFPSTPQVADALEVAITKAVVPGSTTFNAPDLAALGVTDQATALLLGTFDAFEACSGAGRMPSRPFGQSFARELSAGMAGGRIKQGVAMPIKSGIFDTVKFQPSRIGAIVTLTNDVLRMGLGAEAAINTALLGGLGLAETTEFLDPSVAADGDAPASITHGATLVPWDGNAERVLSLMLAAISTPGVGLAWIARPRDLAILAAQLGGAADLPRTLLGLPIIPAPNAPSGQVTLADLAQIPYAAGPLELDLSEEATLEMEDPTTNAVADGSPDAPVPTQVVSLYQANAVAFKISRLSNWLATSGSVAYTVVAGSPS